VNGAGVTAGELDILVAVENGDGVAVGRARHQILRAAVS
jgi:hypothetical protein